jgi:hypothetical protein
VRTVKVELSTLKPGDTYRFDDRSSPEYVLLHKNDVLMSPKALEPCFAVSYVPSESRIGFSYFNAKVLVDRPDLVFSQLKVGDRFTLPHSGRVLRKLRGPGPWTYVDEYTWELHQPNSSDFSVEPLDNDTQKS